MICTCKDINCAPFSFLVKYIIFDTQGATVPKGSLENFDGETKLPGSGKGLKAILGGLEELWDQSQYTEEYNLNQFLSKLNG